jgi:hypothetical protein
VADGIETVSTESHADAPLFGLSGRPVNRHAAGKGIYIKDGKKFIVK